MFGNKNNEKTSGEDKLNTLAGKDSGKKPSASLEKTEGKKEKFAKLFSRKDKKEEKVSLYEPEMEFITEEELKKEEEKKKDNMQPGEKNSLSGSGSILNNNSVLNDEKNGARSKIKDLFRKKETGAGAALPGGFSSVQKSLFDDDPILYEGEEKKGLGKLSKKKLAVIAGAAVIVIGAASYFILTNLGGSVDGTAYVESVKDIMGYGSGSGMNNRYTGEVEAQDSWDITLQSDLSVAECYVEEGAQVKKGDRLFSYNTEEMQLAKERAELEVETLQNENSQLERDISSYRSDLNSASTRERIELQTEILTAQTTIKRNEYSISSANKEIKDLEKNINDATVTSKMDGVVQKINEEVGVSSSSSSSDDEEDSYDYSDSGEESTYMTIVAVGDYRVKGSVSETNVWSLTEGDSVIIRSRVDNNTTWTGTISSVNTDETEDSEEDASEDMMYMDDSSSGESASTYNFYVELDSDDGLMMGQHVFIELDFGQDEEKEGIWLPSAYIYMDEDKYYVWAANGRDRLELREVTIGEYNQDLDEYQILDGLEMSDLIASDTGSLQENMRTTTDISEVDSTDEYYEEETSDDMLYDESAGDEYLYDESAGDEYLYDESADDELYYDDGSLSEDVGVVDEGF